MDNLTSKDLLHYHLIFRNVFKDILRPDKTPISQFEILMIINEKDEIKVGELSDIMSITRPNLTPLVDNLAQSDFIKRIQDPIDKRITRLSITCKGKEQLENNLKLIEERFSDVKTKYSNDELKQIKDYCEKLKNIINK